MAGKGSGDISLVGPTGHSVTDARQPRASTGLAQEEKPVAWLAEEGTHTKAALLGSRLGLHLVVLAASDLRGLACHFGAMCLGKQRSPCTPALLSQPCFTLPHFPNTHLEGRERKWTSRCILRTHQLSLKPSNSRPYSVLK